MRPEVGKKWLVYFRDFFNPRAESKVFEQMEISELVYIPFPRKQQQCTPQHCTQCWNSLQKEHKVFGQGFSGITLSLLWNTLIVYILTSSNHPAVFNRDGNFSTFMVQIYTVWVYKCEFPYIAHWLVIDLAKLVHSVS